MKKLLTLLFLIFAAVSLQTGCSDHNEKEHQHDHNHDHGHQETPAEHACEHVKEGSTPINANADKTQAPDGDEGHKYYKVTLPESNNNVHEGYVKLDIEKAGTLRVFYAPASLNVTVKNSEGNDVQNDSTQDISSCDDKLKKELVFNNIAKGSYLLHFHFRSGDSNVTEAYYILDTPGDPHHHEH